VSTESTLDRFRSGTLIDEPSEPMEAFLANAPEGVADDFVSLLVQINRTGALDYKTKALLRVCASMILDHDLGVRSWSRAAFQAGATRAEVIEAMYTLIPQVGAIPVIRMLPEVLALDEDGGGEAHEPDQPPSAGR
jgi:alkylhydroperoxidase/carboxymuconolactone decarboxylase family protein YurZ